MGKVAVTYHAPKGDERVVETRGLTFFDGQTQELDADEHKDFLAKAEGNPHFEVGEARKKPGPKPKAEVKPEAEKPEGDGEQK